MPIGQGEPRRTQVAESDEDQAEGALQKRSISSTLRGPDSVLTADHGSTVPSVMFKKDEPILGFLNRELALAPVNEPAAQSAAATVVRPDSSWRITDHEIFTSLGWVPGATVEFTPTSSGFRLTVTAPSKNGHLQRNVDARQRLLLPTTVRQALGVERGEGLFLAMDRATGQAHLTTLSHMAQIAMEEAA